MADIGKNQGDFNIKKNNLKDSVVNTRVFATSIKKNSNNLFLELFKKRKAKELRLINEAKGSSFFNLTQLNVNTGGPVANANRILSNIIDVSKKRKEIEEQKFVNDKERIISELPALKNQA